MNKLVDIEKMLIAQRKFAKDRNWDQFHTPKNIAIALNIESSELMEIFQWLKDDESKVIMSDEAKAKKVNDEIADVLYYLLRMSDVLDIDLEKAFWNKLSKNEEKYPIDKSFGNAKKYTEF